MNMVTPYEIFRDRDCQKRLHHVPTVAGVVVWRRREDGTPEALVSLRHRLLVPPTLINNRRLSRLGLT